MASRKQESNRIFISEFRIAGIPLRRRELTAKDPVVTIAASDLQIDTQDGKPGVLLKTVGYHYTSDNRRNLGSSSMVAVRNVEPFYAHFFSMEPDQIVYPFAKNGRQESVNRWGFGRRIIRKA